MEEATTNSVSNADENLNDTAVGISTTVTMLDMTETQSPGQICDCSEGDSDFQASDSKASDEMTISISAGPNFQTEAADFKTDANGERSDEKCCHKEMDSPDKTNSEGKANGSGTGESNPQTHIESLERDGNTTDPLVTNLTEDEDASDRSCQEASDVGEANQVGSPLTALQRNEDPQVETSNEIELTDRAAQLTTQKEERALESIYHIKWIKWKGINTPIITQNENGPCPLLAIVNVLLLQRRINIPSLQEIVTSGQLMEYIGDCILEESPKRLSEGAQLNYEQNMHDAIAIMNKLQTGLDVNVKFTSITEFEFTPECVVFDLLSIGLYHGWLVDPQNTDTLSAVGELSYNQLVEKIIASKQQGAESQLVSEGLIGEAFLEETASQLTYHGLCELNSRLQDDQLGVFFRNNHFSTFLKRKDELFLLVTDQGFLTEDRVIWESLANVEGDSIFVDAEFRTLPAVQSSPEPAVHLPINQQLSQEDQDFLVALTLQQEQDAPAQQQHFQSETAPIQALTKQTAETDQEWTDRQLAMQLQEEERIHQQQMQQQQRQAPPAHQSPTGSSNPPSPSQSQQPRHQRTQNNDKCIIL